MRKIISLCVCLCAVIMMYAQAQKVTGLVLDAKTQEPLIGVSVLELGTTNGVVTDLDGNFTLSVQPNAKLQLSYIGYHPMEMLDDHRTDGSYAADSGSRESDYGAGN